MRRVVMTHQGRQLTVGLKQESANPTGSIKDRTAAGLLAAMDRVTPLVRGSVVIESTSGNLGLALADRLLRKGCRFIAVIDPKTPGQMQRALHEAGAEVIVVDQLDRHGGYLLTRLAQVRTLCAEHPEYCWLNQYDNPANPNVHAWTTGPEITVQAGGSLAAVYVAVSTGGTLAGISRHLRASRPDVRIVAVDTIGSRALSDSIGRRLVTGIGSSRPSSFLSRSAYDAAALVRDVDAFAMCQVVRADLSLCLGGSSGSVLSSLCAELTSGWWPSGLVVCVCPDGGERYIDTFYDPSWLAAQRVDEEVDRSVARLRRAGVSFHEP